MNTARVTFYSRQGCHLCVTARETVARVTAELGVGWEEVDVDSDPDLQARMMDAGFAAKPLSAAAMQQRVRETSATFGKLVSEMGLKEE